MALPRGARTVEQAFQDLEKGLQLRVVGQDPRPRPDSVTVWVRLNGSGKTELCVQHPTGAVQIVSTEP